MQTWSNIEQRVTRDFVFMCLASNLIAVKTFYYRKIYIALMIHNLYAAQDWPGLAVSAARRDRGR